MEVIIRKILFIAFLVLNIALFAQIKTSSVYIKSSNIDQEIINKILSNREIEILEIEKEMNNIIRYYENNGYPFAKVKLQNINNNEAEIYIEKGSRYIIDSLIIHGESKISEKHLFNIINIKKGEAYNQEKINNIPSLIESSGYIRLNNDNDFVFRKNEVDIYLNVYNQKNNIIDGLIGFSSSSEKKISLHGFMNTQLNNIIGKGESIILNWKGNQNVSQQLSTHVHYPYIFNSRVGIYADLEIFKQYDNFQNVKRSLGLQYNINPKISYNIYYYNLNSRTENNQILLKDVNSNNVGLGFNYNGLENNNLHVNIKSHLGRKQQDNSNKNISETHINAKWSTNIKKHFQSFLMIKTSMISSDKIYENELFRFGGSNSLKGFDENSLLASTFSIATTNISYNLDNLNSMYLFYQQAYLRKEVINEATQLDWPRSIGAGINMKNKSNTIYIEYAIGASNIQMFNVRNGRIHVGLQNVF